ncbi:hypothetical protein FRC00_011610 [Tulasnella sp. 408]|nr:hypothetical protein FRC00_011610 [Tulasnella sp. 408]
MVVTRSKVPINYKELSDDEMEDLNTAGAQSIPKRKRTRTARNSKAGGGSKSTQKSATGDPLTRLPLDVVYEILGLLTPLDLLRLARTTKALRSYLMSKRSLIAWKAARAAATPPVPICPKDMSEPQLAVLLFTEECTVPPNHYYLLEDVRRISEVVELYQLRLEAQVAGSRQELEQFLEAAKSSALEQAESAKILLEWRRTWWRLLWERKAKLRGARKQQCVLPIPESIGHNLQDAQEAVYYHPNVLSSTKPLTDAAWKRLGPKAERLVEQQYWLRVEREEHPIRTKRRAAFKQRYLAFKSSSTATLKTLMPSENVLMRTCGSIKDAIEADGTDTSSRIFDDAFLELPTYLDQWRNERKSELARIILEARNETGMEVGLDTTGEQDVLYLATSVFATCGNRSWGHDNGTVHWADSIGEHFPVKVLHSQKRKSATPHDMQCIQVVSDWVKHIKLIVQAVGLDPNTATFEDMDNLNARFYCNDCSVVKFGVKQVARSWRNCVDNASWLPFEIVTLQRLDAPLIRGPSYHRRPRDEIRARFDNIVEPLCSFPVRKEDQSQRILSPLSTQGLVLKVGGFKSASLSMFSKGTSLASKLIPIERLN